MLYLGHVLATFLQTFVYFNQINTELLPLVYVENWFTCSILGILWLIFFKLCIWVDIGEAWFGIIDGYISSKSTELLPLIYVENWFWCSVLRII